MKQSIPIIILYSYLYILVLKLFYACLRIFPCLLIPIHRNRFESLKTNRKLDLSFGSFKGLPNVLQKKNYNYHIRGVVPGGAMAPPEVDQLTLSQLGEQLCPPNYYWHRVFLDLSTALYITNNKKL